jgi:putative addiction module killer protein
MPIELRTYLTADERAPFDEWLAALRDVQARARIRARLARVQAGNFGDFKPLLDGVQELRIDHGPGYRVYLSRQGPVVVLLLRGSDKSGQAAAIKQALTYLKDWRKRGEP